MYILELFRSYFIELCLFGTHAPLVLNEVCEV